MYPAQEAPATLKASPPTEAADLPQAALPKEVANRTSAKLYANAAADSNAALGWEQIAEQAVSAFLEDNGEARVGWDQLQLLIERYLKPIFVAQALASRQPPSDGRATNYSALARRLFIADGSTVKTHLSRFEERFSAVHTPPSGPVPSESKRSGSA